jgi:hypothetical protein
LEVRATNEKFELSLIPCAISSAKDVGISWLVVNCIDVGEAVDTKRMLGLRETRRR